MNRRLQALRVIGIVLMFGALGGAIVSARAAALPDSIKTADGHCLGGLVPVRVSDCDGSAPQGWEAIKDDALSTGGRCLDVDRTKGTAVLLADCDGSKYQRWHQDEHGALVNLGSAQCLQPAGAQSPPTAIITACSGAVAQSWHVDY